MSENGLDYSYRIFGVEFQHYSSDEIKKISVKEIVNPSSYDSLQNAFKGGLYDPELGTQKSNVSCEKCGLSYSGTPGVKSCGICPGHLGYISFPLPVFNPVNFSIMFQLLKSMCFTCGLLLKPKSYCLLFLRQMQALDHGLLTLVDELYLIYKECYTEYKDAIDNVFYDNFAIKLDTSLSMAIIENQLISDIKMLPVKHAENLKKDLCKKFYGKKIPFCWNCHKKPRNIRQEHMARIFFTTKIKNLKDIEKRTVKDELADTLNTLNTDRISMQDIITPSDAKRLLKRLWLNQKEIINRLCGFSEHHLSEHVIDYNAQVNENKNEFIPTEIFFVDNLLVSPSRMRPTAIFKFTLVDNPQTMNYKHILNGANELKQLLMENNNNTYNRKLSFKETLHNTWFTLQTRVNASLDQQLCKIFKDVLPGIKQIIEKKEGLLRRNIMGKRVNCSARSVISPDPYLGTNEVGLPVVFAKKLLYTESVVPRNFHELKKAVINGPDVHPGAFAVELNKNRTVLLKGMTRAQRESIANQLLTPAFIGGRSSLINKKVKRHLKNGDIMILNRQPTLHKPSMQAFRARVLPMEKTLRINYTPCKAFNADFDGDEMNAHFPQNDVARSEGYYLAHADQQYLVPKDGTPVAGLIQDHMVSGVLLTMRGRFFSRKDYQELVYAALTDERSSIKQIRPSVMKPCKLWSGKQVLSTLLLNLIPKGQKPLSLKGKSKIPDQEWINVKRKNKSKKHENYDHLSENDVLIIEGELLVGVLDKNHYGATSYGLVHCCYELYGGEISGKLLTCLGRLFTFYLRSHHSFTMGIEDVLISDKGNNARKIVIGKVHHSGHEVVSHALQYHSVQDEDTLVNGLKQAQFSKNKMDLMELDGAIKTQMSQYQDAIKKSCWPQSLLKAFPDNNLQLMVISGAKGSVVNCMQISCLLGQVDLEGCRPPMMVTGATLPSFKPYDLTPRAGGFIDNRFLTGLYQQEFFFHCMAGREGLVDTAVKTSRSGYLQRCLIKHLEGLVAAYDGTVRESDGSIIQFKYGEDGLDVLKTAFLKSELFPFLIENQDILMDKNLLKEVFSKTDTTSAIELYNKLDEWKSKHNERKKLIGRSSTFQIFCEKNLSQAVEDMSIKVEDMNIEQRDICKNQLIEKYQNLNEKALNKLLKKNTCCPNPVLSILQPGKYFESTSEKFHDLVENYILQNPNNMIEKVVKKKGVKHKISFDKFRNLLNLKYQQGQVHAGEAIGVLAATSMGEQTTQMTLNTFHFAGHGAMNVTLGIPRLREILMTASKNIKTPLMYIPLAAIDEGLEEKVEKFIKKFRRIPLERVIQVIEIKNSMHIDYSKSISRVYSILIKLKPRHSYEAEFNLKPSQVLLYLEQKFLDHIIRVIEKNERELKAAGLLSSKKIANRLHKKKNTNDDDAEDDTGDQIDANNGGMENDETDETKGTKNKDGDFDENDDDDDDKSNTSEGEEDGTSGKAKNVNGYDDDDQEEDDNVVDDVDEDNDDNIKKEIDEEELSNENDKKDILLRKRAIKIDGNTSNVVVKEEIDSKDLIKNKIKKLDSSIDRIKFVCSKSHVKDYKYDAQNNMWCEFLLEFSLVNKEMDLQSLVGKEVKKTIITQIPRINNCIIKEISSSDSPDWMVEYAELMAEQVENGNFKKRKKLQLEGINIPEMYKYQDKISVDELYTNDINTFAQHYGIEAATQVIVQEIRQVFKAYGIVVDYRHLSLIADYMTFEGSFKPFNRLGLESNSSPLQKMSFESALNYLRRAIEEGSRDNVDSPSARLVIGRPIKTGTGCFDIIYPI